MDLDLKMKELNCCEKTQQIVISHEESLETAIPEYCLDVTRVVDSLGQLKIREKTLSEGRLSISGVVKVTVLYTSEETAGLRSLILPVPFTCTVDDPRLHGCRRICASGRLQLVEARAVTARKLYVRVMPEFEVEGIRFVQHAYCAEVKDDPTLHVHRREQVGLMLTGILERVFQFNQEFVPERSGGKPEDLLFDRIHLKITECQRMGSKLIVKGEAALALLYRTEEQMLRTCDTKLPFSQIIDGADLPEDSTHQAHIWVEDSDIRLVRTDNGVGFGVSMRIGVMVKVYENTQFSYIDDLYSTKCGTIPRYREDRVDAIQPEQNWQQEAVQRLEFGQSRPFACVTGMECGAIQAVPEGEKTALRTNLRMKVLYLDETGAPISTERTMEVAVHVPHVPDKAQASCAPVIMNLGNNSCEIRIPVDFFTERTEHLAMKTLTDVELQELEREEQASLVLRRIGEGESLWDIAKSYRTDPALIEQANDLEPGAPLPAGMLLIPKVRN